MFGKYLLYFPDGVQWKDHKPKMITKESSTQTKPMNSNKNKYNGSYIAYEHKVIYQSMNNH